MKRSILVTSLSLLAVGSAHGQTSTSQQASDLTRMLNGAPPSARSGAIVSPARTPPVVAPPKATSTPIIQGPATSPATTNPAPRPVVVSGAPPSLATPAPVSAAPATVPASSESLAPTEAAPASLPPPPMTVLDARATAALAFAVVLPQGFRITEGRPGPDFHVYTIRRGDRPFVMVYTGQASQFPIYSGQVVEAGGRATVVSDENNVRHAREHLFQRLTAPREIHIWVSSLEGADAILAEQIAGSIDAR